MRKVVINNRFDGGFELSHKATMRYAEIKGIKLYAWLDYYTTKKFYGDKAQIGNDAILHHYSIASGKEEDMYWLDKNLERDDPVLVQVVEEMGKDANGRCARLKIVEIPDDVEFVIEEWNGIEWIAEKHRTWA